MKKIKSLAIFFATLVIFSSVAFAAQEVWRVVVSNQKFTVDGKEVKINALNINGNNYVKIADIANVLDISIAYDEKTNTVSIDKSQKNNEVNIIKNTETGNDISGGYEVYSYNEFIKALESNSDTIVIKRDMEVSGEYLYIEDNKTVVIEKGVTLNITMNNFIVGGQIINYGTINVPGRIEFYYESPKIGAIKAIGNGEIVFRGDEATADEISYYLSENSIYNRLNFVPADKTDVIIDKNLTIPKGKTLWLNINCTLVVSKGSTLTVKGWIRTFKEPVINGVVVGEIIVQK